MRRSILICAALAAAAVVTPPAHSGELCEIVVVAGTPIGGCVTIPLSVICTSVTGLEPTFGAVVCIPLATQGQANTAR